MQRLIAPLAVVFCLAAQSIHAQVCRGLPSFAAGMVGIGANAYGAPGVTGAGASVNIGRPASMFGGAQIGLQEVNLAANGYSDFLVTSMRLGVNAGYEISLGNGHRMSLCPIASFGHRFGPNYTSGSVSIRESGNDFAGELAFGGAIRLGSKADLVPSISVGYSGWNYKTMLVGGGSNEGNDTAFDVTFSTGVVIASRFGIRPFVSISSQENSDPSIGLAFRVQLGQKR